MAMKKALVYFTDEQLKALRLRARSTRRSMAALVRDAVSSYLGESPQSPLEGFIGCAECETGGETSARADEILKRLLG